MYNIEYYKRIFDRYGGMMRTTQLAEEKVFYPQREKLIADGYVEKVRRGYYQWINLDDFSEAGTVTQLFPDACNAKEFFRSSVVKAYEEYSTMTVYKFSVDK